LLNWALHVLYYQISLASEECSLCGAKQSKKDEQIVEEKVGGAMKNYDSNFCIF
jgi:alpha-D-ribose 1-methylphosphonate 5-phosphate C-P lyase